MIEKFDIPTLYAGAPSGERFLDALIETLRTTTIIKAKDMALHMGEDRRKLSGYVEVQTGKSLQEMIDLWRVLQAHDLIMQDSTMSNDEISAALGYRDRHSLVNNFTRRYGLTPYDYRLQRQRKRYRSSGPI